MADGQGTKAADSRHRSDARFLEVFVPENKYKILSDFSHL